MVQVLGPSGSVADSLSRSCDIVFISVHELIGADFVFYGLVSDRHSADVRDSQLRIGYLVDILLAMAFHGHFITGCAGNRLPAENQLPAVAVDAGQIDDIGSRGKLARSRDNRTGSVPLGVQSNYVMGYGFYGNLAHVERDRLAGVIGCACSVRVRCPVPEAVAGSCECGS